MENNMNLLGLDPPDNLHVPKGETTLIDILGPLLFILAIIITTMFVMILIAKFLNSKNNSTTQTPTPSQEKRYCRYCGKEITDTPTRCPYRQKEQN